MGAQTAFISGNDTICDNGLGAIVKVDFTGTAPFTFVYSINGVNKSPITTQNISYLINTKTAGTFTLVSYNDAVAVGSVSGSAIITVLESPTAIIHLDSDTLSTIYPVGCFFFYFFLGEKKKKKKQKYFYFFFNHIINFSFGINSDHIFSSS